MERYTINQIFKMNTTKGDLFKKLEKSGKVFDYALPQGWLNVFSEYAEKTGLTYHFILSTTVWVYPESMPFSICQEVQQLIDEYMNKK